MAEVRQIVLELLAQLGSSKEARQYLKEFSSVDETRFAVVKAGGGILRDHMDELASALSFLHRLGLRPVVLHGAGPQVDEALAGSGIESLRHDGLRVTTEAVMAVARPVIYDLNMQLVEALEQRGIRARGIQHGVFRCDYLDREKLGLVGEIRSVNLEPLRSAVRSGALPVLTFLGESNSGQVLNINADFAARELVWAVKPHKIVFLTPSAGLLDRDGRVISAISLDNDYQALMNEPWVHSGMRVKLQQINEMLLKLDRSTSVSITSADQLTRELFTYRGAGTLVRRGESIDFDVQPTAEKLAMVAEQVEVSFDRKLRSGWAAGLEKPQLLMAKSQRAAAVVVNGLEGTPYLDKFVVTPDAQGEGLASAMWQVLNARFPKLYWRSRNINPITSWYFHQADTSYRKGQWVVFTAGIDDPELREKLIQDALVRDPGWQESPR
ncbi:MAG: acetylglutamate kinase [Xanthomonadales bacterium]|nr:acetylglutamate kinase [Gammaproteobacteria bacterium]NNE04239.1 acetylglutamate kinase [Xanthomonadales bacterium]NNL94840.1 acetylglutamate kinase [Xanthomonadales bacterium]